MGCTVLFSSAHAEAQADAPPEADAQVLLEGFERDEQAFEAAMGREPNCEVACRAFESMVRAAERLCELDAGERCAAARTRVQEAGERLRDACPECVAARRELLADHEAPDEEGEEAQVEPEEAEPVLASAPPPAADSKRGTCAACTVGADEDADEERAGFLTLLVLAAVAVARRSRRTPPRRG